jgi:hypothetical protein
MSKVWFWIEEWACFLKVKLKLYLIHPLCNPRFMFSQFLFPTISFMIHVLCSFAAFIMGWLILDARHNATSKKRSTFAFMQGLGFFCAGFYILFAQVGDFTSEVQAGISSLFLFGLFLLTAGYYWEPTLFIHVVSDKKKSNRSVTRVVYRPFQSIVLLMTIPFLLSLLAWWDAAVGTRFVPQWQEIYPGVVAGYLLILFLLLSVKWVMAQQRQLKSMWVGVLAWFLATVFVVLNGQFLLDLRFSFWTGEQGGFAILYLIFHILAFSFIGLYALSFLRFRLKPRMFINFIAFALTIFFTVTVVFLLVLLRDFQNNTLQDLYSSGRALEIGIVENRNDATLAAKALVSNADLIAAVKSENSSELAASVNDILKSSGADFIVVTNEAALTLYDTLNPEVYGGNLSEDKFFGRALQGVGVGTLTTQNGILAPLVVAKTYLPVVTEGFVIGAVEVGFFIDNQLVDSVKKTTGLDMTVFVGNVRSATTFTMDDGVQRLSGTLEQNTDVTDAVLTRGETYSGVIPIFNVEYLSVYIPLKDDDGNIIGMIFVGEPSQVLVTVAQESVQTTLRLMSVLILLSLIPMYFFVKRSVMSQMV